MGCLCLRLYYSLISREVKKSNYDKSWEISRNLKISQKISKQKMWQFSCFLKIPHFGMSQEIPDPRFLILNYLVPT